MTESALNLKKIGQFQHNIESGIVLPDNYHPTSNLCMNLQSMPFIATENY